MPVLLPSQSQSASFMFPSRLQVTSQQDSADVTVPTSILPQVPQYGDLAQSLVVSHTGNPIPVRQLAGNTLHPATPHASPTVPNVTPLAAAVTSHGPSHINEVSAGLPSHQPQSVHFVPSTVPLVSSQLDNPDETVPHSTSHQTAHYCGVAEPSLCNSCPQCACVIFSWHHTFCYTSCQPYFTQCDTSGWGHIALWQSTH